MSVHSDWSIALSSRSLHKSEKRLIQGKKKHISINKFAGLSRDWVGAKILFMSQIMCFLGHSLWGRKTHKQSPPQTILGQSRVNVVYMFLFFMCFFAPADMLKFLRHVMRGTLSVRPKCSHRCVSLTESPLKPVHVLQHATGKSTEQTSMRTKWLKHIAI